MREFVQAIHEAPGKGYINFTGGGFRVLADLMGVGGGSNTLLGSLIPYDTMETNDLLGYPPENYAASEVAEGLGMRAFEDSVINLGTRKDNVLAWGMGATASLAKSGEEREGRIHQFHVYIQDESGRWQMASWVRPNTETPHLDRESEEKFMSDVMIGLLYSTKVCWEVDLEALLEEQGHGQTKLQFLTLTRGEFKADFLTPHHIKGLQRHGEEIVLEVCKEGTSRHPFHNKASLFPGSFNPYHFGHDLMVEIASTMTGHPTLLELSLDNATKPPVSWRALEERLVALTGYAILHDKAIQVVITRAPLFLHKMTRFPGRTWVMGYDTMTRLLDPQFADLGKVKEAAQHTTTRFLVFPRAGGMTFPESTPWWFKERAVMVPNFDAPVSSTAIRAEKAQG